MPTKEYNKINNRKSALRNNIKDLTIFKYDEQNYKQTNDVIKKYQRELYRLENNKEYNLTDFDYFYNIIKKNIKLNDKEYQDYFRRVNTDYYKNYYHEHYKNNYYYCKFCEKDVKIDQILKHDKRLNHIKKRLRIDNRFNL